MKRSIFLKYFSIITGILLASFMIFGGSILLFARGHWITEKNEFLNKNIDVISKVAAPFYSVGFRLERIMANMSVMSQTMGGDIYISNTAGEVLVCSDEMLVQSNTCYHIGHVIPKDTMTQILSDGYSDIGVTKSLLQPGRYTVAQPLSIQGKAVGAVFASIDVRELQFYLQTILQLIVVSFVVAFLIAFFSVYVFAKRITKPLRMMVVAASKLSKGEMIKDIPIKQKDEIGQLAESFNTMATSLSSLELMRRNFVSSVSHELKTPMTTIMGFVDGILDGTIPPEKAEHYLKIVSEEVGRLSRLVQSMLQISRLEEETVKVNKSWFNVTDVMARTVFSFEEKINAKQIEIKGFEDCEDAKLYADPDLIYQVAYNLVENAVKFTPDGGEITIGVKSLRQNKINVFIQNSGEGLTAQELSHIFERFYKTDRSRSQDKTGVGFGLYIIKNIMTVHGGKIKVSSTKGEYTRFELEFKNPEITKETKGRKARMEDHQ